MRLQKGDIVKHFKYETLSDEARAAGVYNNNGPYFTRLGYPGLFFL